MKLPDYLAVNATILLSLCISLCGVGSCPYTHVGAFGDVIGTSSSVSKGGVLETVVIYPQKTEGLAEAIARKGFLIRYPNAVGTVLICHGFMCNKHDVAILRKIFKPGFYNVMTFDFRAHGQNTQGQCCTFGKDEALDVACAAKFLRLHPQLKNKPVFAYGFSMGASAAIQAQANDTGLFDGMILDCPFDCTENVIKKGLEQVTVNFFGYEFALPGQHILRQYAFHPQVQSIVTKILKSANKIRSEDITIRAHSINPALSAKNITVPCFFIHCKNDEKIEVQQVKDIYNNVNAYKRLWITDGRSHFDSFFYNPEHYTQQVRTFLDVIVSKKFTLYAQENSIDDSTQGFQKSFFTLKTTN